MHKIPAGRCFAAPFHKPYTEMRTASRGLAFALPFADVRRRRMKAWGGRVGRVSLLHPRDDLLTLSLPHAVMQQILSAWALARRRAWRENESWGGVTAVTVTHTHTHSMPDPLSSATFSGFQSKAWLAEGNKEGRKQATIVCDLPAMTRRSRYSA